MMMSLNAKTPFLKLCIALLACLTIKLSIYAQQPKTQILILGSDHFSQVYKKGNDNTDVLSKAHQADMQQLVNRLKNFHPDLIAVEELPEAQVQLDSLFQEYRKGNLPLDTWEQGRSEIFQIGFRLARLLNLSGVFGVNAPGGTSQAILDNGENIELYQKETQALRKIVGEKYAAIQSGALNFLDFLKFVNQPSTYNLVYHLRYITPARVTNGVFTNPDEMVDTTFINKKYIGAELTSIFRNRDYKIYSNLVTRQMANRPKRILLIIGVAHIGSLKSIFRDDPEFELVDSGDYLSNKAKDR